jgi:hypothetical protein
MDQENLNNRVKEAIGLYLFSDETRDISSVFQETESLLAGGFVLNALNQTNLKNIDMDIYVNISNTKRLLDIFTDDYNLRVTELHTAPAYDQSFFRKNNIIERIALWKPYEIRKKINVDIMVIPDHIDVKTVVQNFDLTFCEIWYDGTNVDGTNVQDSLDKKGYLRDEYRESLSIIIVILEIQKFKK